MTGNVIIYLIKMPAVPSCPQAPEIQVAVLKHSVINRVVFGLQAARLVGKVAATGIILLRGVAFQISLWYSNINEFVILLYAVEDIDLRERFKLIFVFYINCMALFFCR